MGDRIDELLARDDVKTEPPATHSDIRSVARQFNGPLPETLVTLWRLSDGVTMPAMRARLLSTSEALEIVACEAWSSEFLDRGFVPFLHDKQSNYLAAIVHDPLAFRIAHVPHDDASRLLFSDLASCIGNLIGMMEAGDTADSHLYKTTGDYPPDAPRREDDQKAARRLMATDGDHDEWNYAAQLLDASNLEEWARLLETDHFVRRDVRDRMKKMSSPAIRELLRNDQRAFDGFCKLVAESARSAGLEVGAREHDSLQVGGKWMNLDVFFHRRNIPNGIPRIIAWFEDAVAGRDPHQRRGNCMAD